MKMHPQHLLVYVTCANHSEAEKIASAVLNDRLAACANLLDGMQSMYWWEEKIVQDNECVLILKSETRLFEQLKEKIISLHSYEVPCVAALPIAHGNGPYLEWISASVTKQ